MARIRTIKPDFWTDEKVVEISAFARLLFIGLWNFADDDGRMVYSPKKIKMQIFPADTLDISELFGELQRESLIAVYTVDNIDYLQVTNFTEHQKIDKRTASRLPPPPDYPESHRIPTTEGNGMEGNIKPSSPTVTDSRFQDFWKTYPSSDRKVGKAACEKKWKAKKLDSIAEQILQDIQAKADSKQWREGYAPAPLTYLNQERWNDDPVRTVLDDWRESAT